MQPPPPPPTPIESGGTYARSSSPETPYLGKRIYPLSRALVTIPFPGFSREISRDYTPHKYPPSWENGNTHAEAGPLCIRVGAGVCRQLQVHSEGLGNENRVWLPTDTSTAKIRTGNLLVWEYAVSEDAKIILKTLITQILMICHLLPFVKVRQNYIWLLNNYFSLL